MESKKIAQRIRAARTLSGVTREDLAERLGVVLGTIHRYENGDFPGDRLGDIAEALEVSEAWLRTGIGPTQRGEVGRIAPLYRLSGGTFVAEEDAGSFPKMFGLTMGDGVHAFVYTDIPYEGSKWLVVDLTQKVHMDGTYLCKIGGGIFIRRVHNYSGGPLDEDDSPVNVLARVVAVISQAV
jgi:transcriptional regulator with XRE-family HTH domain